MSGQLPDVWERLIMSLKNASLTAAEKLCSIIDKVVIVEGRIPTDPVYWDFYIKGNTLRVDIEKLGNPRAFEVQYLKAFRYPAPKISANNWRDLLETLAEEKAESIQSVEESANVFIAYQVFEIICDREITNDPDDAISQESLLIYTKDGQTYYAIPSDIVKKLVDGSGYRIPLNELSMAMSDLKLKKEGTYPIRYNGPRKRSWLFVPSTVLKVQQEN